MGFFFFRDQYWSHGEGAGTCSSCIWVKAGSTDECNPARALCCPRVPQCPGISPCYQNTFLSPMGLEPGTFNLSPAHYRLIYPIRSFFVINVNDNIIMADFNISQWFWCHVGSNFKRHPEVKKTTMFLVRHLSRLSAMIKNRYLHGEYKWWSTKYEMCLALQLSCDRLLHPCLFWRLLFYINTCSDVWKKGCQFNC